MKPDTLEQMGRKTKPPIMLTDPIQALEALADTKKKNIVLVHSNVSDKWTCQICASERVDYPDGTSTTYVFGPEGAGEGATIAEAAEKALADIARQEVPHA